MAATPTVISKTREQVYIPPKYRTRKVTRCYYPPPKPKPSDPQPEPPPPSSEGKNCSLIITRVVTLENGTAITFAPGEGIIDRKISGDNIRWTLGKVVCD